MGIIVPNTLEIEILTDKFTLPLTLRIFGNNYVPVGISLAANFTEIAGGGYVAKPLTFANWVITPGDPSFALYNAQQIWTFTGPINAPATIFGYYVTRNSDGKLMWAERFPVGLVPFTPILGSIIKVIPKFVAQSEF
jgi:hypothetical protein